MLDNLYDNIGGKIKNWAQWIFIVEAIAAIIGGIFMIFEGDDTAFWGIVLIIAGPVAAWVSSWILYAFGDLVDNISAIKNKYVGGATATVNTPKAETPSVTQTKKTGTPDKPASATPKTKNNTDKKESLCYYEDFCPECGKPVNITSDQTETVCPWCKTNIVLEFEDEEEIPQSAEAFKQLREKAEKVTETSVNVKKDVLKKYYGSHKFLKLGNDITKIGKDAFEFSNSLRGIIIPDKITDIGSYAFNGCRNLSTVIISGNIESLKSGVFSGCTQLRNILIPATVTDIDEYAFENCSDFTIYTYAGSYAEDFAKKKGISVEIIK